MTEEELKAMLGGLTNDAKIVRPYVSDLTPSHYQQAIYDHVEARTGNLLVEAVAGSGKTTTIVEAVRRVGGTHTILMVAFNKHIATELSKRVPFNCEARTLHSIGFECIKQNMSPSGNGGYIKVNEDKCRNILHFEIFKDRDKKKMYRMQRAVLTLVSLMKNTFDGANHPEPATVARIYDLDYGVATPEEVHDVAFHVYTRSMQQTRVLDFDDMIFYPLAKGMPFKKMRTMFVDEAQDLNGSQMAMLSELAVPTSEGGIVVAVGDRNQSIYAFRGADPQAMNRIKNIFAMHELPLSVSYRCPVAIVQEARKWVPVIDHRDGAEQGDVGEIEYAKLFNPESCTDDASEGGGLTDGDFVLCRTTAPLVELAIKLIELKRKAVVRGRDFGNALEELLPYLSDIEGYRTEQFEALKFKPAQLTAMMDRIDTLAAIQRAYGDTTTAVRRGIRELFSDTAVIGDGKTGILLSTIHRSKGLEADRVFLLRPDLVPHPSATSAWAVEQERNLQYIAVTRSKSQFYYVKGGEN